MAGLARRLGKRCRVQRRGSQPTTYELLLDPSQARWPDHEDGDRLLVDPSQAGGSEHHDDENWLHAA